MINRNVNQYRRKARKVDAKQIKYFNKVNFDV